MDMPRSGTSRARRQQRPISCDFCRLRKLRCSRNAPCSNCVAREARCSLEHAQVPPAQSALSQTSQADAVQTDILVRLHRLEEAVAALHPLKTSSAFSPTSSHDIQGTITPRSLSADTPSVVHHDVAWLGRICVGPTLSNSGFPGTIVFNTAPLEAIMDAPRYLSRLDLDSEPIRMIFLPEYEEMKALLNRYVGDVSYIQHVIHVPSLPGVIESVYSQLKSKQSPKPGPTVLVLSIIAMVTYMWNSQRNDILSLSSIEVENHWTFWVKASQDALGAAHESACVSLETVQAMILISWIVCNSKGLSIQYRTLMSTALVVSRELGLHRCDHPDQSGRKETIEIEIGRRVWWYLVATDWMVHSRFGSIGEGVYQCHPEHMIVKEPRNINDSELFEGAGHIDHPASRPTEMSYFLQRIRLAKVSKTILDRNLAAEANLRGQCYGELVAADAELDRFLGELPPFFNFQDNSPEYAMAKQLEPTIIVQAYMINSLVYIQRCKLHLPYLARDVANPAHEFSRQRCLEAARSILSTEKRLVEHDHPFAHTRMKLSGILYGLFVANIVFLVDICINKATLISQSQIENRRKEAADAFRLLETARHVSRTAAHLLESLMELLEKHKVAPADLGMSSETQLGMLQAPIPSIDNASESSYFDELTMGLEYRFESDGFQWENILGSLSSSSLF